MTARILLVLVIVGIILTVSPRPIHNNEGLEAKKPAADKGARLYADNNVSVYILSINGPDTGGTSSVTLPPHSSQLAPESQENSTAHVRRDGNTLLITREGVIYSIRLGPKTALQSFYPDPRCAGDKIIVDKNKNLLYLYKKGALMKIYQVSTGIKTNYTPEGKFSVVNKYSLPHNNGKELLGPRWLGISVPDEFDLRSEVPDQRAPKGIKYGIHGTNEPNSIGTYASGGCIRLHNKDIVEIYDLVSVGTPVEIIR